ncbi:hypothetical protein BCU70_13405, partial [Vibrio sp. 10N.286.49.C2]
AWNNSYHGKYGHLLLNTDGTWHYDVTVGSVDWVGNRKTTVGTTIDKLGEGQTLTDTITIQSKDGTTHDIVITIHGSNDRPYCRSEVQLNSGKEDTAVTLTAQDLLGNTVDVDHNDIGKLTIENIHPTHGSITDNHDGTYTFTPTKNYNGPVHFSYDVHDGHGGVTSTGANMTLQGVGDAAVISGNDASGVTEDRSPATTGQLQVTDVDSGEAHFVATSGATRLGTYSIDSNGQWRYTLKPNVQSLHQNETMPDTFTVQSADGTAHQVHITISGTADAPTISGTDTGSVDEDTKLTVSGDLKADDKDWGQSGFWAQSHIASAQHHGDLSIDVHGHWTFHLNNTDPVVQALGDGEHITDTVVVNTLDGTSHQIQVTIEGTNDAPEVSGAVTLSGGTEDTDVTIQSSDLLANATDIDHNDAGRLTVGAIAVDHGSITDNHDGTYTLHQEANYNGQVSLTYDIKDAHGGSVATSASLNLAPVRDAALISGTDTDSIVEDQHVGPSSAQTIAVSGSLSIIDPDTGENHFQFSQLGEKAIHDPFGGDLRITPAGNWGYAVTNSRLQSLSAGEVETVVYRVHSADYTSHDITITVTGTNDAPVLTAQSQSVTEGGMALTGQMSATDVDTKDTHSYSLANPVDGLTLNSDGSYSFDPKHSAYQHLGAHDQQVLTIPVTVDDHHGGTDTKNLTITVQGSNDGAIITGQHAGDITEDKRASYSTELTLQGSLHVVDPDGGEAQFTTVTKIDDPYNTHHNGLTISKSGSWHYIVENNLVQNMAEGETKDIVYEVQTVDGTKQRITITLHGTNDNPTLIFAGYGNLSTGSHPITTDEDKAVTIPIDRFVVFGKDIDHGDTLHIEQLHVDRGTAVLSKDGQSVIYTPEKDFNGHATFTYQVVDSHGALAINPSTGHPGLSGMMLDVNAMPDNAVIGGDITGSVTEDNMMGMSLLEAHGTLTITDPDAGEAQFLPNDGVHNNGYETAMGGLVTINPKTGDWSYVVDNFKTEVQSLGATETAVDTVTIHSKDGTAHTITINIHGTNDDPILSVTQTTPTTGTLTETDVDVKDTHSFSVVSPTGQFGDLSVDPTSGAYVYTPNSSVSGMSYNSATHTYHGADVFEVKVADNHGGESSRFLTFDTNGQVNLITGQQPTITTTVPQNPIVTTAQPSLPTSSNTPPSNTVTVDLVASSDSGKSDTDNLTNDNTPTITGHTDIPYSQVTIYDGSTPIGHAVSDGSGQYSAVVTNLTDGDHNLSAKALAPSSVLPATSSLLSVHVDTTIAPLTIELTHDTGSNTADLITNDGALTITGHEAGAAVEYSTDNGQTWTSSFTPQQGVNTVSVRQTDTAGNVSASTSLTFTLDDQIAAPSIDLKSSTDSGASQTDDLTNIHTPIITGSAEANSLVSITDETGKVIASGAANNNGIYQLTTSNITEGKHTLTVEATDIAGNHQSNTLALEVDYTAPNISKVNLKTETTHQPTFRGTVSLDTANVDIVIKHGSTVVQTLHATLDGNGGYSVDASHLPDGRYTAYIQATDKAGNQTPSGYTGEYDNFSVDTHAKAPTISFESTGSDNLYNAAEVAAGAANTITASIHLPDDVYAADTLIINGVSHVISNTDVVARQVNVEVLPGSTLSASIIDSEGNQSTLTSQIAPTADLSAAPLTLSLTHDTGSSAADLITNDGALTISGQEVGAIVEYSTDNGVHWSQSFTAAQGANTVTVRQTDSAGNVSPSSSLSFTLDNQVTAPSVSLRSDTSGQFHPTADLITQDARLSIQTEAGAQVEYSNDGGQSWSSMFNPIEGVNNLLVRQTDIAGNQSATTHFSFTLDTTPGTVSVNPISTDNALNAVENNQALVITGTTSNIAAGDRVYLNFGNNHFREASVHSDGTWSLTVSASDHQRYFSADGSYPIKIGSVDLAGNATPEISTHLIVDTQNPIPHISVDSVTRDNIINLAESGQNIDITGHVSGNFNVGDAVSLSVNGATLSVLPGVVDSQGNYSISVPAQTLIKANIHSIYASSQQPVHSIEATIITTDQAGNIGSATTGTQAFSIDKIASANIQLDPVTADNVINAAESNHNVSITGHVSGDVQQGDTVNILVGQQTHTGIVDQNGQFSIDVAGSELTAQTAITATVDTTDNAGNPAHASQTLSYVVDTQVDMPTITFENPGSDNAYSKAEIAQGHAGTITATVHAAADAKIGEHININGVDHVLDAHSLQHGLQIEVAPGSHVQVTMTDEHGNTAGSQGFAASAIPDPIIVKAPPGSHQVSGSLGTPPLLPSLTPVPNAQHGWRIHLPDGSYVTSHHGQYGTLTIDPQTGDLHYQEQANVHTGPHGSASGIGQHEDKFEVALQGTNQDEVVAHVNVQILSHGPGHSGKLNIGTEVVDMTITPITHTSHPTPPPPQVLHDEPDMSSQADFTVTQSDDSYLDLTQHAQQEPDQKSSHHGAAAYLDALGIKPDATSTTVHDQPADMDIVLAQVDQQDAATHDQAHLDMSDALEHHDANVNHNQDDEHHHHNDVDGLPDIDPNP